jgi:recombination protein RecT
MSNLAVREKEQKNKVLVFQAQKQFEASNEYKMNFNREAGFAIQILTGNDFLASCDQDSIRNAVVNVSLTGLTLNPALKYAYLIPRKGKCILDISYMGMIKVLTDAGAVKNVDAGVIYKNDKFDYRKGTDPYFKHQPTLSEKGEMIGAYAIAFFRDGGFQFEILGREDVEKIRNTSESYKNEASRKFSPWETWEDEMWKKTALKRLFKLLPKTNFSDQLIAAISNEHANDMEDLPKEEKYERMFDEVEEATVITEKEDAEDKALTQIIIELETVGDMSEVNKVWESNKPLQTKMAFVKSVTDAKERLAKK